MAFLASGLFGMALTSGVIWLVSAIPGAGIHWPKIVAIGMSFGARPTWCANTSVFATVLPVAFEAHSTRQRTGWAAAVAVLAVAMRLGAILYWGEPDLPRSVDQGEYVALGQNVRLHGAFSYGYPHPWGAPREA